MARPRPPVTLLVLVAVIAVAVVAVALGAGPFDGASGPDGDPRAGSRRLPAGRPLAIDREPLAYRVEYRVEVAGAADTGERVTVRRPFESRRETYDSPGLAGRPATVEVAAFGRLRLSSPGGEPSVIAAPPGPPPADLRLHAVLDAALGAGRLERREWREVLGRRCQVVRSRRSLLAGEIEAPSGRHHTDTCVDRAGLVLEEVVVAGGARASRRVATAVDERPSVDDRLFATGEPTVPGRRGGGSVVEVAADSAPPGPFWELGPVPPGFRRRGRYAVVPPQVDAFTDPGQRGRRVGAVVDVLVDGADVVLVERGGTLGNVDVIPDRRAAPTVDLGPLGTARLLLAGHGPTLEVDLGAGRYLRVVGTVDPDRLAAVARGLREVEGTELRVIEGG